MNKRNENHPGDEQKVPSPNRVPQDPPSFTMDDDSDNKSEDGSSKDDDTGGLVAVEQDNDDTAQKIVPERDIVQTSTRTEPNETDASLPAKSDTFDQDRAKDNTAVFADSPTILSQAGVAVAVAALGSNAQQNVENVDVTRNYLIYRSTMPPPVLEDGEVIDAKNTMRSYSTATATVPTLQQHHVQPSNPQANQHRTSTVSETEPEELHDVFAEACIIVNDGMIRQLPVQQIEMEPLPPTALPPLQSVTPNESLLAEKTVASNAPTLPTTTSFEPPKSRRRPCWFVPLVALYIIIVLVAVISGAVAAGICLSSSSACSSSSTMTSPDSTNLRGTTTDAPIAPTTAEIQPSSPSPLSPSTPLSNSRATAMETFINSVTFTNQTLRYLSSSTVASTTTMTAEELALQWLVDTDPLQLVPDTPSNQFRIVQRYALRIIWVQREKDPRKLCQSGWSTSDANECNWYGLDCVRHELDPNVGFQNYVTQVSLIWCSLAGTISMDVGLLSHLDSFDVYGNDLTGSLPSTIGMWSSLVTIDVDENRLTGTLPETISAWSNTIQTVSLSDNNFSGTLPIGIGLWTNVQSFEINNNAFRGTIPESIANWTHIAEADFYFNALTGTMPFGICSATNLTELWADCDDNVVVCSCCTVCF